MTKAEQLAVLLRASGDTSQNRTLESFAEPYLHMRPHVAPYAGNVAPAPGFDESPNAPTGGKSWLADMYQKIMDNSRFANMMQNGDPNAVMPPIPGQTANRVPTFDHGLPGNPYATQWGGPFQRGK